MNKNAQKATSPGFNHVISTLSASFASDGTSREQKDALLSAIEVLTLLGENPQRLFWDEHDRETACEKVEDIAEAYGLEAGQGVGVSVGFISRNYVQYVKTEDENGDTLMVIDTSRDDGDIPYPTEETPS